MLRDREDARDDEPEEREEKKYAEKAPLFRVGGKDEIGLILRKKLQFALCAVADTLPRQLPRTHGDGGLVRVVAGATYVGERMQKGHHALFLVRMQPPLPERARAHRGNDKKRGEMFPRDAGDEDHAEPNAGKNDGAAKIGLKKDEYE